MRYLLLCFFHASAAEFTWYQVYDNIMWYQVTVELRLRECYQAMILEAISEEDWLMLTLTVRSNQLLHVVLTGV